MSGQLPSPETAVHQQEALSVASDGSGASSSKSPSPTSILQYPRRTHKKSRTGCAICKARKVKCDERHPSCLNCITHGVKCPFLTADPSVPVSSRPTTASNRQSVSTRAAKARSTRHNAPPISTTNPSPPTPAAPAEPERDDLPYLELELLHNFTTSTCSTLAADPGVCDFWRITVVQIGFQCDYIMLSVLALSALHLAYHRPSQRDFYTAHSILLHQRALRSATRLMPTSVENLSNAINLFLFSMLTVYFALASPRRSLADGSFLIGSSTTAPSTLPDWTFLLNGAKSLSAILGTQGHDTVLAPFLEYGHGRWHATRDTASHPSTSHGGVSALRERVAALSPPPSPEVLATYSHALDELEIALLARQDPEMPRDVLDAMLWLWAVSDSLMPLLRGSEGGEGPAQEAVAIFAHYSILLRHHESTWWLQGWAKHLVIKAWEILDDEHRGWIEWPMREVEWFPGTEEDERMGGMERRGG